MKFQRRKIALLLAIMVVMTVLTATLCSFTLPDYTSEEVFTLPIITQLDAENILSIVDFQQKTGQFNNLIPVVGYLNSSKQEMRIILINPALEYTFSLSGTQFTITSTNNSGQVYYEYFFYLKNKGFSIGSTITGYDSINQSATFSGPNCLFYRQTKTGDMQLNANYSFPSGNGSDTIAEIAEYWFDLYNVIRNYESDIENAESVGFSNGYADGYEEGENAGYDSGLRDGYDTGVVDGYESGYDVGYESGREDGYNDGFDTGMDYGYQFGYQDGVATGRAEGYTQGYLAGEGVGYESGYADGYDEGYINGYDTGKAEGGGTIVPSPTYELDIPAIFDGMFTGVGNVLSAFDIELFGINIVGVLLSLLVIVIVAFIVRKLMK